MICLIYGNDQCLTAVEFFDVPLVQSPRVAAVRVVSASVRYTATGLDFVAQVEQFVEHPNRRILHTKLPVPAVRVVLGFALNQDVIPLGAKDKFISSR